MLFTFSTKLPSLWSHSPVFSNSLVVETARVLESLVWLPVRPLIVTLAPVSRGVLVLKSTVMVLVAPG